MDKGPDAFRTISEVAEDLDLPQHVLRFWETRFAHIKPLKRGGGRRYYRPDDVDLLKGIRHLLYGEGYTIRGVQRILKDEGIRFVQAIGRGEQSVAAPATDSEGGPDGPLPDGEDFTGYSGADSTEIPSATVHGPMSQAAIARLRAALGELMECERVLSSLQIPAESNISE